MNGVRGGSIYFFPSTFNLFLRKTLGKLWHSSAWEKSIRRCLYTGPSDAGFPRLGSVPASYGFMPPSATQIVTSRCYLLAAQINSPLCFYGGQFWILRGLEGTGRSLWLPAELWRGPWNLVGTMSLSKHLSHNGILTHCLLGHGLQTLRSRKAITFNITEPAKWEERGQR